MTTLLTGNLPLLAGTPKGIQKLRELILELAVRGKLVPQDPNEEPASELLKRIAKEKNRRAVKGSARKQKLLAEISDKDKPFEVPKSWEWVSLGELGLVGSSSRVHQKDWQASGVPFYRAREIVRLSRDGHVNNDLFISEAFYLELSAGGLVPEFGDIMLTGVGTIGVPYRVREFDRFYFKDASVLIFKSHLEEYLDYLLKYFVSQFWVEAIHAESMGTTVHTLTIARANEMLCPLPPVAEQRRIVAKVDELMVLCDRLEAQQADAKVAHLHLVQTLLDSLTQAVDAADFSASWKRLSEHFDTLLSTECSVDALKQTLLKLAVMGKLVPQDATDENASDLLLRAATVKARKVTEEGLRTSARNDVPEEDFYIQPSDGWAYARLGNLAKFIDYRGRTPTKTNSGVPLITAKNVRQGFISREPREFIAEADYESWMTRGIPHSGDMLFTTEAPMGNVAIVQISEKFALAQRVICFQLHVPEVGPFLRLLIMSDAFQRKLLDDASGMTATGIKASRLKEIPVPLPPLAEQGRIIAKVEQLMLLCDQLKTVITKAKALGEQFADAVVAETVEGTLAAPSTSVIHISSYLVRKLAAGPTFGRTAHMKWLFLADQHLGLALGMNYERQAAGPLDKLIYQIEEQAALSQLYAIQKETLKSGIEKIVYRPDVAIDRAADAGAAELGDRRAELDRLIGLLGARKTEELEIVATLYAVWNDALVEGHRPDDEWLINEFRTNWHKEKERFSPDLLAKWLSWMREHRLVPAGKISSTRHQGSLLH